MMITTSRIQHSNNNTIHSSDYDVRYLLPLLQCDVIHYFSPCFKCLLRHLPIRFESWATVSELHSHWRAEIKSYPPAYRGLEKKTKKNVHITKTHEISQCCSLTVLFYNSRAF